MGWGEDSSDVRVSRNGLHRMTESFVRNALAVLPVATMVLDDDGDVVATNEAWRALAFAHSPESFRSHVGMPFTHALESVCSDEHYKIDRMWAGIRAVQQRRRTTFRMAWSCAFENAKRHYRMDVAPMPLGQPGVVVIHTDVTDQEQREARLRHQANHDPLTGLPNRRTFIAEAEQMLAIAVRHDRPLALLFLDLDGFKEVNDVHGHDVGDAILCLVAERFRCHLRESDLMARVGGDEFVMLLPETLPDAAVSAAERYYQSVAEPFCIDGNRIEIHVSIGVAHFPHHGKTRADLLNSADAAMYEAKASGCGICVAP